MAAFWPSGEPLTSVIMDDIGGNYSFSPSDSSRNIGHIGEWLEMNYQNGSNSGWLTHENISFTAGPWDSVTVNTSIMAVDEWILREPRPYTPTTGILGLGPPDNEEVRWLLGNLKSEGKIASNTFGLHMGSAVFEQPGSLVLGGYDSTRALGPIGKFVLDLYPLVAIVDVFLGTEMGGSAFREPEPISVYKGVDPDSPAAEWALEFGAPRGSIMAIPNPAAPYIYLPVGVCETAAEYLPVRWDAQLGLFLWNVDDPDYKRIVSSPAYLGFVLVDQAATNITVKVPLRLLNLTLVAPLVETPTQYFPCKPYNDTLEYNLWTLGRAWLQAAFMFIDYERNETSIAQAPGPGLGQAVIQTVRPGDDALSSNPLGEFASSWASSWTLIEDGGDSSPVSTPIPTISATSMSTGAVVGIGVGAGVGGVAMLLIGFFAWRRKMQQPPDGDFDSGKVITQINPSPATTVINELSSASGFSELGDPMPHEIGEPAYEGRLNNVIRHELPAEPRQERLDGRERGALGSMHV
jgi:hypothetical protein